MFCFLETKDKTPFSTNEMNYVPDVKRNYRSKSLLPKPFVLPPSPRTKEKQLKEQIIKTSIVRERVECPPNLKPGDEVMFKYGDRMFNYTIPDNLPKSRMMDLCFPVDITELDRSLKLQLKNATKVKTKKKKKKKLTRNQRMPVGPLPTRQDFVNFMIAREKLRINKTKYPDDPSKWTQDSILCEFKFTNVKREHDRTTIAFRKITDSRKLVFRAIAESLPHPHTRQDEKAVYESEIREAGLMAFNCCVRCVVGVPAWFQPTLEYKLD